MTIKPVLVPDQDAASLRKLMDSFAEAASGPTKKQLTESVEQGVSEGSMYDEEVSWEKGGRRAPTGAFRNPAVVKTNKSIGTRVSDTGSGGKEYNVKTDKEWDKQKGVAEAAKWRTHPDAHDHDTDGSPMPKGGIKNDPLATRQGVSRTQSEKDPKSLAGKFGDKYAKKHGVPTKQLMKNIPLDDIDEQGVAEGRAGIDDVDTVGFSVNSEAAYNAVMQRFGDAIDHDETSGIMYAPARLWPRIEMVAFDADGEGAVRDEDITEVKHFKTSYGYAGGSKPSGGQYRHPESAKADSAAKKTMQAQQQKNKQSGISEGNPTSDPWIAYDKANPNKIKKFKTRNSAKAYADKHGYGVASFGFYVDHVKDKQGMAEAGHGDANRLEHRGAEYNVYFNTGKGMYTARGTGQMKGQIAPQWFRTLADAQEHAEMEIGGYDDKGVAEGSPTHNARGLNNYIVVYSDENSQRKEAKVQARSMNHAWTSFENAHPNYRIGGIKDDEAGVVEESVDPVAQLRADILRFSR
jgi:hypothetical protein